MATKNEGRYIGDVIEWEANENFCREVITVAGEVDVVPGTPLDRDGHAAGVAGLITNTNEANVDAIALETITGTGAGNDYSCVALVRGPANVNGDQLSLETDVTVAEMQTNLLANIDVVVLTEPTSTNTGVGQ